MGRKRKENGNEKASGGQNRSPHVVLSVRLDEWLGEAYRRWLAAQRPEPSNKAVIQMILEDFLREKGYLPEVKIEHTDKS